MTRLVLSLGFVFAMGALGCRVTVHENPPPRREVVVVEERPPAHEVVVVERRAPSRRWWSFRSLLLLGSRSGPPARRQTMCGSTGTGTGTAELTSGWAADGTPGRGPAPRGWPVTGSVAAAATSGSPGIGTRARAPAGRGYFFPPGKSFSKSVFAAVFRTAHDSVLLLFSLSLVTGNVLSMRDSRSV